MAKLELGEFPGWNNELIKQTLLNRTFPNVIEMIISTRDYIQSVIEIDSNGDYPDWYVSNMLQITTGFVGIVKLYNNTSEMEFQNKISKFRNVAILNYKDPEYSNIVYTLPFLENYARSIKLEKNSIGLQLLDASVNDSLKKLEVEGNAEIDLIKEKFDTFRTDADTTLSLIKKEVGKIGVKEYAEIFDKQAYEHSSFFIDPNNFNKRRFNFMLLGKAQWWIIFAIVAFLLLIYSFTQLDNIFSVKGQYLFSPEVVVHIIGRFLVISLFIFVVSFCFKQFRVNMHLYTLNKHRANTLKSFDYLTRAPDPLSPDSYNAILMEVAKSIYESGQTGYINLSDNNADMPSIIDLSKVITQPRT